jgi:hypothetical protein
LSLIDVVIVCFEIFHDIDPRVSVDI